MPRKDIYKAGIKTRFKRQGDIPDDVPLAAKTFGVRLPADIDKVIRALPEPTAWVRQAIIRTAHRELLGTVSENTPGSPPDVSHVLSLIDQLEQTRLTKRQREIVAAIRQWLCETKG